MPGSLFEFCRRAMALSLAALSTSISTDSAAINPHNFSMAFCLLFATAGGLWL
jgi:hypothetical protein